MIHPPFLFQSIVDELVFAVPAIQLADFFANFFGAVFGGDPAHCIEMYLRSGVGHVEEEVFRERSVLDVLENLSHRILGVFRDDFRAGNIVAIFCRIGDE